MFNVDREIANHTDATNSQDDGSQRIGLEFDNETIAYDFYNACAAKHGFSVRIFWHDRSKSTEVIRTKKFVCSKQGFSKKNPIEAKQRNRADTIQESVAWQR